MTEELITTLSGVNGLSVIARTSVMKYKDKSKGASEVAKELSAGTLVEGSVRKAGDRVRITVQLIDGQTESHAWAQNYDAKLDDIFEIQSKVARQVVDTLQVKLLSADGARISRPPTTNIEAYTQYLKGQHYFEESQTFEGLRRASTHFEEAIANDPNFALAYAGLAYCITQMGFFGMIPSSEAGAKAKMNAIKALELDPDLAEAHQIMGRILRNFDWDFHAAEGEFTRAIQLNPSFAEAYGGRALMLCFNRRFDEGLREVQKALELDPVSGIGWSYAGTVYLYTGRYEDSIRMFSKVLEVDPASTYARGNRGLARVQLDMFEVGISDIESVASIKNPSSQTDMAFAYSKAGKTKELRDLLESLLKEVGRNPELAVAVAGAYANLGDKDRAMEWLEKAFKDHVAYLVSANSDFVFDAIREDSRFQDLMKRIGWTSTR
jgi:tetratricopeptide (TPR) repeat protein